jgi:hypothetical protein
VENEKLKGKLLNRDARIEYLQNEVKAVCALRAQALARTDELLDELRVIHDTWSLPHMAKVKEEDFPYSAPAIEKILRKAGRIS